MVAHNDSKSIAAVAGAIRWLIEMGATLSEFVLILTVVVLLASDVSGGSIIRDNPLFGQIYSWGQAFGIDGQTVALAILSRKAWADGRKRQAAFLTFLVLLLGGVTFIGVGLANESTTFGKTITAALADLGITDTVWSWLRAGILVLVSITGAYLLYIPAVQLTEAQVMEMKRQKRLRADLDETDRQLAKQKRTARIKDIRDTFATAVAGAEPETAAEPETEFSEANASSETTAKPAPARRKRGGKLKVVRPITSTEDAQKFIRAALITDSDMGAARIQKWISENFGRTISTSTIARHKDTLRDEILAARRAS